MNRKSTTILNLIILCFFALQSCNREQHEADYARLQRWDRLSENQADILRDSLAILQPEKLSRHNRAYYGLLKTIADDKTYVQFTSDSLISSVENYFRRREKGSDNHLRALIYQGIVRIRMGIADSTACIPLKDAEALYLNRKNVVPSIGYMLYYHSGDIQFNNDNFDNAHRDFNKALHYAKQENDSIHIFDSYLAFAWNEMAMDKTDGLYLDSTGLYLDDSPDKRYDLLNARSYAAKMQDDYAKALQLEKQQIALVPYIKTRIEMYRVFYSVSTCFYHLNQLDSALFYAEEAIKQIKDTTHRLNYILYENAADIAEGQQNIDLANRYRKKALEMYEAAVDKQLDTQIVELEKKYDLSEAENKALRTSSKLKISILSFFLLLLLLILFILYYSRRIAIIRLKREKLEEEKKMAEVKEQLAEIRASQKEHTLSVYTQLVQQHFVLQQELIALINKNLLSNSDLSDTLSKALKSMRKTFNEEFSRLFPNEVFLKYTGFVPPEGITDSERLILFMLVCNIPDKDIALILGIRAGTYRSRKNILKEKLQNSNFNIDGQIR